MRLFTHFLAAALALAASTATFAQAVAPVVGGVAITTDGLLQMGRATPALKPTPGNPSLTYLSLPRALDQWKSAKDAGTDPPADVRFLKGLTRIQNVFIYPDQHDIVIAGPAEPLRTDNPLQPLGTLSNRPALHLEDMISALRALDAPQSAGPAGRRDFFGCSIDPPAGNKEIWDTLLQKYAKIPSARATLLAELKKQLGPQEIRLFGVPEDSRIAFVMLAADYRLKRLSMGLDAAPAGVGNAMGNEAALARLWFEPAYEPLLVSPDGASYEFRGPRLKVLAGAQVFHPGGAGPAQLRFADNLSAKMNETAARSEAIADLQNVADCFLLAALIRQDRLLDKTGLNWQWMADTSKYKLTAYPTARTAETVIHISGATIATGGVSMSYRAFTSVDRKNARLRTAPATDADPAFSTDPKRPTDSWFVSFPAPTPAKP